MPFVIKSEVRTGSGSHTDFSPLNPSSVAGWITSSLWLRPKGLLPPRGIHSEQNVSRGSTVALLF